MSWRFFRLPKLSARMRECAELRKRASDYLEADISEEERQRILKHLEECESCSGFMETLRSTVNMLHSLPVRAIPQDLKSRLFRILEEQGQSRR